MKYLLTARVHPVMVAGVTKVVKYLFSATYFSREVSNSGGIKSMVEFNFCIGCQFQNSKHASGKILLARAGKFSLNSRRQQFNYM